MSTLLASRLTAGLLLAATAFAQAPAGNEMYRVTTSKVKIGMNADYEAIAKETSAAFKQGGAPWRHVWTTSLFGDVGTYITVTPISKFAEFDQPSPLVKAMGEAKYQQYVARVGRCLESVNYKAVQFRKDLSLISDRATAPTVAMVATAIVATGKDEAYEAVIKNEIVPALRKAGVKDAWVHRTMFGGNTNEYTVVILQDKWAELDAGSPLLRALGPEGLRALRAKLAGMTVSVEYSFIRNLPELGFQR
ncbi:MAG: hypothetical protein MUC42_17810 [Bryobacter sp.]|nr:hypothetical protein [Bryobacter sp.]